MTQVLDKNGVEIFVGDKVRVHQDEEIREAVVVAHTYAPTINQPGYWVDININNQGPEGMMSYILEVIK